MTETSKINLTQEAMAAVVQMCGAQTLNANIDKLEWVEDELQRVAEESGISEQEMQQLRQMVEQAVEK